MFSDIEKKSWDFYMNELELMCSLLLPSEHLTETKGLKGLETYMNKENWRGDNGSEFLGNINWKEGILE